MPSKYYLFYIFYSKLSKISIITDNFNVPISIMCTKGSIHDSTILQKHLDKLYIEHPILYDNTKTIVADAAYGKIT